MDLKNLPDDVIQVIRKYFYRSIIHKKQELNQEFNSYLLESDDIGSTILYRIDGMPALEEIIDSEYY